MDWAVIIAGGSGTRFWPLSTKANPKQLLPLAGPQSTAEATLSRLDGLISPDRVLLVTGPHLVGPLQDRLNLPRDNVLVEPAAKSTGPALLWATHEARTRDPSAVILAQHADWYVPDAASFGRVARTALSVAAAARKLVTVGVVPTRVEPGYGYIVPGDPLGPDARAVVRFVEKPAPPLAETLIAEGALWNSGLFAWRADTLIAEIERLTPELAPGLIHLDRGDVTGYFAACREIAIDVGIFERSHAVAVVRGDFAWDDIGTWDALARVRRGDQSGNVTIGPVSTDGANGCIAWSAGTPIVLAGVSDLVVVAANDRILVMPRSHAANLKKTLDVLPIEVREVSR